MDRLAVVTILVLFLIMALSYVFLPYLAGSMSGGEIPSWFYLTFFFTVLLVVVLIKYFQQKYKREYEIANIIAYSPKNKYGWYALIFFIFIVFAVICFALLTK